MRILVAVALAIPTLLRAQCPEPEARQFDFWRGEWNVNNRYLSGGVWNDIGTAEVRVFPVTGRCGIVELWDGMMGQGRVRGFSARAWDPADSAWVLVLNWPQPGRANFGTLRGSFRHGRGDFYTWSADSATVTRYSFADITTDRFRWNDGVSRDSGATWRTQWIMEYERRSASARPLMNAALAGPEDDPLCTGEAFDATSGLLGRWRAQNGATLMVVRAIGGCAVLLFLEWGGAPRHEFFAVIGRSASLGRWQAWTLSTLHRGFQELSGESAPQLTGDGALTWSRGGQRALTLKWTDPAGSAHEFVLRRPGG